MFLDRRLFSVTDYQNKNCKMDKKYFDEIDKLIDIEFFCMKKIVQMNYFLYYSLACDVVVVVVVVVAFLI